MMVKPNTMQQLANRITKLRGDLIGKSMAYRAAVTLINKEIKELEEEQDELFKQNTK